MPPIVKTIIGFLLSIAAAWIWHAPLGHGERLIDRLEVRAKAEVAKAELPDIKVSLARNPLARAATLSGPANDLQREGLGSQMGLSDYARDVAGISGVRWADEPGGGGRVIPLFLETAALAALAYLIGLGLGWFLWGRRRERFD
ncbi:MAG: hypothetical protein WBR13_08340 [Allosphingosinicella sp.]